MNKYKVNIQISYNYGSYSLSFNKDIELPFVPFYNLNLTIGEDDYCLRNNETCLTEIYYDLDINEFQIFIREYWKRSVSDETIDNILIQFKNWTRDDNTDIDKLKELMERNI